MEQHRYINEPLPKLELDKKRFRIKHCPCGKSNKDGKFVPYVGYENKGYCHSCGESFLPELPKVEYWNTPQKKHYNKPKIKPQAEIDFIPFVTYRKQLSNGIHLYQQNSFIQWLGGVNRGKCSFDALTIKKLIETYLLGNSGKDKYKGWVLFPYIDIQGRLRDIKAMDYNPNTGKRIREPYNKVLFLGKEILNNPKANTVRCFYGEHLLKENSKQVKIFESEATATYAASFYPDSVCIATGGNNGCNWTEKDKCNVLQGRQIILYPDIDAHDNWEQKAEILRGYGLTVQVSQLIKNNALKYAEKFGIDYSELVKQKYDLRDILQHKDLKELALSNSLVKPQRRPFNINESKNLIQPDIQTSKKGMLVNVIVPANRNLKKMKGHAPETWEHDITELETFFKGAQLPTKPIKLNQCSTITNVSLFVESHFATVKMNSGKPAFLPYLNRLQELKQYLKVDLNRYEN